MLQSRRVAIQELGEMIPDVSKTCNNKTLPDHLGYAKVCARWVPRWLTEDHQRQRVEVAREFLQSYKTDEEKFLNSIVTRGNICVHSTTPERKQQSRQCKHPDSPKPRKLKQTLSAGKVMVSLFWDREELLLCKLMPAGTTVNADRCFKTLENLRRAIQNKRRMLTKGMRFHQDNAHPHIALVTTNLCNKFE